MGFWKWYKDGMKADWERRTGAAREKEQDRIAAIEAKKNGTALLPGSKWCIPCEQAVRPVRPVKLGRIALTGGVGYLLTKRTICPICKGDDLKSTRPTP